MLEAARDAQTFAEGKTRADLDGDRMLTFALVRALEVVGEAASQINQETQAALPQIPWRLIVGMRNQLIHEYRHVDTDLLWQTIVEDLPPLVAELEKITSPEDE
jgi:uncharacterized protein with HEPN domain